MAQARLIYDREMREARRYWSARLSSISLCPILPLDRPRPENGERAPDALRVELDPTLHAGLRKLTSDSASLLFAALVLGLRLCCDRYAGREATIFSPITDAAGTDLVPISEPLDAAATIRDALLATRSLLAAAYRHQRYGLTHLRRDLPDGDGTESVPLVAAMSGLHSGIPDLAWDVAVLFEDRDDGCGVEFRYDSRIHSPATVRTFFETFQSLLLQAIADMGRPIGMLRSDGGSAPPQTQGAFEPPASATLDAAIEKVARTLPGRPAVVDRGRTTSFAALVEEANRLAATLEGLQIAPGAPIAILAEGGLEAIVSMLAVSKTNRPFALVRPALLRRPLAEALAAVGCTCAISGPDAIVGPEQEEAPLQVVITRSEAEATAALRLEAAITPARGTNRLRAAPAELPARTACLIVRDRAEGLETVALRHSDLLRVFGWLNEDRGIGPEDRALLLPGLHPSDQLYSAFGLLMAGGSVEIASASGPGEIGPLAEQIARPEITVWLATAPLLQKLTAALSPAGANDATSPRRIFVSGESQNPAFAARLAQRYAGVEVTGLWGAEALGLWSLCFPYSAEQATPASAAVAHEIPGFKHVVRNPAGYPAPRGVAGDLHVRRRGEPETAWRATGMRASTSGEGSWTWLRGADHAVRVRDCTVELVRLESLLGTIDGIDLAEVVAAFDLHGRPRVFAFVAGSGPPDHEQVLRHLLVAGEADLVPDHVVRLEQTPLGPDAAIDSAALLADRTLAPDPLSDAETEEIRAKLKPLWLRALQQDEVDEETSFFAAGGNSLKATLLITRIKEEFGVELAVQAFFRKPTLGAIALLIHAGREGRPSGDVIADLMPVSRRERRIPRNELERPARTA